VLRTFCLKLLGRDTPEAAMMIGPLAFTMILSPCCRRWPPGTGEPLD